MVSQSKPSQIGLKIKKIFTRLSNPTILLLDDRMRKPSYKSVDQDCYKWLPFTWHKSIPISGNIPKTKPLYFAKGFGFDMFQESNE